MSRLARIAAVLAIAFGAAGSLLPSPLASAAPQAGFSVNSTFDEQDASLQDGVCLSTPSGLCTLRAAVQQANQTPGADTIILQSGLTYRLTRAGIDDNAIFGDLDITESLAIQVQGDGLATVDGNGAVTNDRVFSIFSDAHFVTLTGLVIQHGQPAAPGGGLLNEGVLVLNRVTVRDNQANSLGGGLFNSGSLTLNNSTVSGNSTTFDGGGLNSVNGRVTFNNSTISGNRADGFGGGLYVISGTVNLANVTLAFNRANADSSGGGSGGGIFNYSGTVNIKNSLLAGNKRGLLILSTDDDCAGTLVSGDYNLIQTLAGCVFQGDATHHQTGVSPLLGPLQDNGGLTQTHALLAGSPALDRGAPTGCRSWGLSLAFSQDQRGLTRYGDADNDGNAECDLGAYEAQPALKNVFIPIILR